MWKERVELYRSEKAREEQEHRSKEESEEWKDRLIQAEKERLLREHLPYIDGFMPKGIIQQPQDEKYFTNTRQFNAKQYVVKANTRPW